jgi:hypothetical protein
VGANPGIARDMAISLLEEAQQWFSENRLLMNPNVRHIKYSVVILIRQDPDFCQAPWI